jgi:hypothetical protein
MIRHFRWHTAPGLAVCAVFLLATHAAAVETRSWTHSGQSDFEKGTLDNLSLSSDGRLTLAPVFRELADPAVAYLWALASDSKGTLYTGGGSPGSSTSKLVAIDSAGKSRVIAELPGLQIQAIAVDKRDRVYAATAPDGKVFRIELFTIPKRSTSGRLPSTAMAICLSQPAMAATFIRSLPMGMGVSFSKRKRPTLAP